MWDRFIQLPEPDLGERRIQCASRVKLEFGGQQHETRIDPSYLRYLYVLAWAVGLVPFNVPVDLALPSA